jgi:hypothetical protein
VSNIIHLQAGYNIIVYWNNPKDANFSHVRIIPAGYEWLDDWSGISNNPLDRQPGVSSYSILDYANTEYITIKCIDKDGLASMGIKYFLNSDNKE